MQRNIHDTNLQMYRCRRFVSARILNNFHVPASLMVDQHTNRSSEIKLLCKSTAEIERQLGGENIQKNKL